MLCSVFTIVKFKKSVPILTKSHSFPTLIQHVHTRVLLNKKH